MGNEEKSGAVQIMDGALFDAVLEKARQSPRRRMNHNLHQTLDENPNRLLNVLLEGTYIAPHRHLHPPKAESFLVLQGRITFFIFDDQGAVIQRHTLGPLPDDPAAGLGIDLAPGIWHTLVARTPHAVCYEVKPGPYAPTNDKEFATWAPREGDQEVAEYMAGLLARGGGPALS